MASTDAPLRVRPLRDTLTWQEKDLFYMQADYALHAMRSRLSAEPEAVTLIEQVRLKMHERYPRHDGLAMQGSSSNAMHYSIEADARRQGADVALNELLAALTNVSSRVIK